MGHRINTYFFLIVRHTMASTTQYSEYSSAGILGSPLIHVFTCITFFFYPQLSWDKNPSYPVRQQIVSKVSQQIHTVREPDQNSTLILNITKQHLENINGKLRLFLSTYYMKLIFLLMPPQKPYNFQSIPFQKIQQQLARRQLLLEKSL